MLPSLFRIKERGLLPGFATRMDTRCERSTTASQNAIQHVTANMKGCQG